MKKLFKALGTIATLAVLLFSFAGCDGLDIGGNTGSTTGGNTGGGTDTYKPVVYAGYGADGTKYELIITRTSKAVVQFTPRTGDSYALTITTKAGATQTSTGKITVSGTTFTLEHTGTGETFSVTVNTNSSSGGTMLSITGDIPIDNSATKVPAPSTLIPPNQTTVAVTGVSLKSTTSLVVGGTETLSVVIDPPTATNKTVTWSSSNGSVATVSANGAVTAVTAGTATITVKTVDGNKTAACTVNVSATAVAVTGVSLNKQSTSLNVGGAETLIPAITPSNATNQNLTWTSSNTSAVTVSTGGLVTAVAAGTATITVSTVDGNKTAACAVSVSAQTSPPVSTIPTFTSVDDMATWLSNQTANSAASPYTVKLNVSSLGGSSYTYGTAGRALRDNSTKYVNLDLSGSTFTSIEKEAFQYCASLTSVTMPDSVTSILNYAFWDCTSLNSVTLSNRLTNITNWAFYNCKSLTGLTIPDSVTGIGGSQVFTGCTSLKEINVDSGNKNYISENGVLYNKDKTIIWCYPAGKTDRTFTIPNSVTTIQDSAFASCTSLTSVNIPDSVTYISCRAFQYCTGLASVTIPDSVTIISWLAFQGCTSLSSVTILENTDIANGVFADCTSLTTINVTQGNKWLFSENGVLYGKGTMEGKNTEILMQYPAGKKDRTFAIPDSVTEIYDLAFSGCKSLTGVTIPDSVKTIDVEAFRNSGLTSITVPDSVTKIGTLAFFTCDNLTSVTFEGTIASGNFGENNSAFPGDLVTKYLAGGKGTYKRTSNPGQYNAVWTKQ